MKTVDLLITISDEFLVQIPALVEKLMEMGLTDIQVMSAVGIITGVLDEAKMADVAQMPGVAQVQRTQTYQLPPADTTQE
ncbi:MAG: hypothetical protein R3A44_39920 [Caldilineaceae bacterium]